MTLHKILLFLAFGSSYYNLVRDGRHIHALYRNRHDVVIGGYQQDKRHDPFLAQCVNQAPAMFATSKEARRFVETCPDPAQPATPLGVPPVLHRREFTVDLGYIHADGPIQGFSK